MTNNPFLLALSRKSVYTQNSYKSVLSAYLKYINYLAPFDNSKVTQFLNYLEKDKKLSQSYLSLAYNVLKLFFTVYDKPFKNILAPKVDLYKQEHPTLSNEAIIQLITTIKGEGTAQEKAFLSISTTFGLRNAELCQITQENIKQQGNDLYLFVNTKKGGFPRWHLIPDQIKPYILNYTFKTVSLTDSYLVFKAIINNSIEKVEGRIGWHAIRRALIKDLYTQQSFSDYELDTYFRYCTCKESMIKRYSRLDNNDSQLFEIDKKIFKGHPFLNYWSN